MRKSNLLNYFALSVFLSTQVVAMEAPVKGSGGAGETAAVGLLTLAVLAAAATSTPETHMGEGVRGADNLDVYFLAAAEATFAEAEEALEAARAAFEAAQDSTQTVIENAQVDLNRATSRLESSQATLKAMRGDGD